jgi:hypothetical protein
MAGAEIRARILFVLKVGQIAWGNEDFLRGQSLFDTVGLIGTTGRAAEKTEDGRESPSKLPSGAKARSI